MLRNGFPYVFAALLMLGAAGLAAGPVSAQTGPDRFDFARPGLDWYTLETTHFEIHFHEPTEQASASRTARVVARVAEDVYGPITDLYGHEPDSKVSIILRDFTDYSNGAAYFFDNMIDIWVPYLDSDLRGDHNWLRNVITHEFTHIVQLQTAMKAGRRWPYSYLQYLSYEDVRRPDVLYGYPDGIMSYPVPTISTPAWFAEGTAQYQRAGLRYDTWDAHRDMLLRTQVLNDQTFDLGAMGGFYSYNSIERETVYNHGYAFTRHLADTYGEQVLRLISEELAEWDNWNISQALSEAVDAPADTVFTRWKRILDRSYHAATENVRAHRTAGQRVTSDGFSNIHPQWSPSGDRLAYLSNRGEDYNTLSLYVRDMKSGVTSGLPLDGFSQTTAGHRCALGHRLVTGVNGTYDWHPDGGKIIFARTGYTGDGFQYSDLYEYDLATTDTRRLTRERRATAPVYAPSGSTFVFVSQKDGTSNLFAADLESGETTRLTNLPGGGQATDPEWHPSGAWIYFARTTGRNRDVYRIRPDGTGLEAVAASDADERTPAFGPDGEHLYFASDRSGIYNIYRRAIGGGEAVALTNVIGGAFMPAVTGGNELAFSRFGKDGYQIARLGVHASPEISRERLAYEAPPVVRSKGTADDPRTLTASINRYDDTMLEVMDSSVLDSLEAGKSVVVPAGATSQADTVVHEVRPYEESFTAFSVFPVLRIDQYNEHPSGLGSRVLRNTKGGVYFSSREILGDMRLLGGLTLGWASQDARSVPHFFSPSRLLSLERDGFLQFDYLGGLPLISERWSPQFSIELYNTRRNVTDGMSIEEFPCTACYPDTTRSDVAYALWEANFLMRSKLTPWALLEFGYRYSPYRVRTESFFSREQQATVAATADRYFIGRAFTATAYLEQYRPYRHSDVLREGMRLAVGYEYESSRLLRSFEIEDGALVPEYEQYGNHRVWMESYVGFRLPGQIFGGPHGFSSRLQGSTILGGAVDDFFDTYVGGLTGARGYPFYGLGGNETLWYQASYHFPIIPSIGEQLLFLYADKLYGRVYADAAMAWDGAWPGWSGVRKDVGAELRLGLGSFYLLPTSIFVSATYSLDSFRSALDDGFVTGRGRRSIRYGREWLWHFGILFDFDLDL